jgi:hypothetical protein
MVGGGVDEVWKTGGMIFEEGLAVIPLASKSALISSSVLSFLLLIACNSSIFFFIPFKSASTIGSMIEVQGVRWRRFREIFLLFSFRFTCETLWVCMGTLRVRFQRRFGPISLSRSGDMEEAKKTRNLVRFSSFWVRFNRGAFCGCGRVFWEW